MRALAATHGIALPSPLPTCEERHQVLYLRQTSCRPRLKDRCGLGGARPSQTNTDKSSLRLTVLLTSTPKSFTPCEGFVPLLTAAACLSPSFLPAILLRFPCCRGRFFVRWLAFFVAVLHQTHITATITTTSTTTQHINVTTSHEQPSPTRTRHTYFVAHPLQHQHGITPPPLARLKISRLAISFGLSPAQRTSFSVRLRELMVHYKT